MIPEQIVIPGPTEGPSKKQVKQSTGHLPGLPSALALIRVMGSRLPEGTVLGILGTCGFDCDKYL